MAPPQNIDLDISASSREFKLSWAEGTTPLIRANLKNAGAAYSATGYTGTLYLQDSFTSDEVISIASTATGATYLDFQLTLAQTATNGRFKANFIMTNGTDTVEWQRGEVDVLESPGTAGADVLDLRTPLSFAGYTFANVATGGPYRAGTSIGFSSNADGSQNINYTGSGVADGDKGDITVSASGATWTIDAGAVTLPKMANLANGHLIGRHTSGAGVPESINIDGGLELNGANIRRSALTGDVTASAGSNATTIANSAVTLAKMADLVQATVLGRASGSGTGAPVALTAAQLVSILESVSSFLSSSGGTVNGDIDADTITAAVQFSGPATGLTGIPATQLTGDIPAASFGELAMEWDSRDLSLETTGEVGFTSYAVDNATRTFRADALSSANASAQTFTISTGLKKVPRGFVAFKTTGAIVIEWIADDLTVADITGIELIGYSDVTGSKTTLYTDSTVRNVSSTNVPVVVSINRSAFSSTTVPTHLMVEISGSIEDGKKMAILHIEVNSE